MRVWRSIKTTGIRLSYSLAMALFRPSRSSSVSKTSIPVCVKSERPLKQECVSRWLSVQSCARNHCSVRSNSTNSAEVRNLPRKRLSLCSSSFSRRQATASSLSARGACTGAASAWPWEPGDSGAWRGAWGSPSGSGRSAPLLSEASAAQGTPKTAPPRWITCSRPVSSGSCGHKHSPSAVTSRRSISKRPLGIPRPTSSVTARSGQQSAGSRAKAV
mmetsp:Transcript_48170/g.139571  ORF Transcript_48170/g.139571 Transcript_48170/m.139571 type:complete len:217 (+) Transcript_48170:1978-2628(+)